MGRYRCRCRCGHAAVAAAAAAAAAAAVAGGPAAAHVVHVANPSAAARRSATSISDVNTAAAAPIAVKLSDV